MGGEEGSGERDENENGYIRVPVNKGGMGLESEKVKEIQEKKLLKDS